MDDLFYETDIMSCFSEIFRMQGLSLWIAASRLAKIAKTIIIVQVQYLALLHL